MKISEKVIDYVEGNLSKAALADFEKELENSLSLQKEVNEYRKLLNKIEDVKDVPVNEDYFTAIIPSFRIKQSKAKRLKLIPGMALGAAVVAAVILYFSINNSEQPVITGYPEDNVISANSESMIDSILTYYQVGLISDTSLINEDVYTEAIDSMFTDELNISIENLNSATSYTLYSEYNTNLVNDISDEEAEIVYNEILNKRFF